MCGRGGEAHGSGKGLFQKNLNENFLIKKNATQMGGGDGICFAYCGMSNVYGLNLKASTPSCSLIPIKLCCIGAISFR